jgi:hypothetical protein
MFLNVSAHLPTSSCNGRHEHERRQLRDHAIFCIEGVGGDDSCVSVLTAKSSMMPGAASEAINPASQHAMLRDATSICHT